LINYILVGGVALIIGIILGTVIRKYVAENKIKSAEAEARRIIEEGIKDSETKKKEAIIEAKDEIHKMRNEAERENKERRNELKKLETRLIKKEENLDKKSELNEKREENLNRRTKQIEVKEKEIDEIEERQKIELEKISGLSSEEAKNMLLNGIKKDVEHEAAVMIKEIERESKETADRKAREVISYAIQKCAADHVAETTVSVVDLPNDEMKGRIIGREGRNIRALETLTGIDLIIDDTPEAVVISGFDPIRREVARIALEKLINDGRIHPARIEEMVDRAKKEIDEEIKEEGEKAAFDTGVNGIHPEIIKLLGRLKYRTSYGRTYLNIL
jgi:ribonuclease Y